ncbi:MAG: 16S rRNA (guanine(966)-N(2))-methyltransferase RsmD [Sinobacteraceae bacterium]|nr:16S rRNA (guanine(966)-N(2))-methyltransferase RsmD [Nevskiaceae bacterium]
MLRIIGGRWRGRRLRFPALADIRPTPDRVRETLFNWLGQRVQGARCLDLFAGSGALGLEALSRGAEQVTFIERESRAAQQLRAHLSAWQASGAEVITLDAVHYLSGAARSFDIVFLDPPFASSLIASTAELLEARDWLSPDALIYVETDARAELPQLPVTWQVRKAKQAGAVGYHLLTRAENQAHGG